jgi:ATP-binding cassette, subfamily B, bacterial CvaB/MchF/RaxB
MMDRLHFGWGKRLPVVLQTEAAECGIACLAMIAGFHGHFTDLADLRRRYGMAQMGATLVDVMRVADALGFAGRPLRLELDEVVQLSLPCIVHWDLNHFVVLAEAKANAFVIHDPAAGMRRMGREEFSRHFTGVALELTPTAAFAPAKATARLPLRALLARITGVRRSLTHLFLLAVAIELFAILSPLFMQWVVDHALVTANQDLLLTLVLGFGLLLVLQTALNAMRDWIGMVFGASLKLQGRANLFSHLIKLPASYFESRYLGDIVSRFGSQETILTAITTDVVDVIMDGILSVITLIIMIIIAPALAWIVIAAVAIYAALRWATYTPLRHASAETIVWAARRDSHFLETMRGMKTIKLMNGENNRRVNWLNLLVETLNRQLATQKMQLAFRAARTLLFGLLALLIVWLGAKMVLDTSLTIGVLLAFIAYTNQFVARVSALINKLVDLQMLHLHADRLADIALFETEPHSEPRAWVGSIGAPAVEVRDLKFRYGVNDPMVLDGVSFHVAAGESVAIVGASGCGKTTLLKILASLIAPTSGEILIDGRPVSLLGLSNYRDMIGVVMQDDQLFAGSIADNIAFFSDRPDFAMIEHCARQAGIHNDISAMPMAYSTLIGDMGTILSGGQKQRVVIARALYQSPRILLLDEATSHLDVALESTVNEAIRKSGATRIIVAHRPETIRSADRVIEIRKGRVVSASTAAAEVTHRHAHNTLPVG